MAVVSRQGAWCPGMSGVPRGSGARQRNAKRPGAPRAHPAFGCAAGAELALRCHHWGSPVPCQQPSPPVQPHCQSQSGKRHCWWAQGDCAMETAPSCSVGPPSSASSRLPSRASDPSKQPESRGMSPLGSEGDGRASAVSPSSGSLAAGRGAVVLVVLLGSQ